MMEILEKLRAKYGAMSADEIAAELAASKHADKIDDPDAFAAKLADAFAQAPAA